MPKIPLKWSLVWIAIAGLIAYANSFSGAFVLDDYQSIVDNTFIRKFWPLSRSVLGAFGHLSTRPIVNLTLAANYSLGGLDTWGYHAVNLTIHILAAMTLFAILRRTFQCERLKDKFESIPLFFSTQHSNSFARS